jgi:flagellar basal-body rod modification protein FlgD
MITRFATKKMMRRIAFLTLTILSLTPLSAIACQTGHPDSLAYIRRDNNRCEGLKDGQDVSLSFRLTSLVSRSLNSYPSTLTVKIPAPNNSKPNLVIQSFFRNYRLDEIKLEPNFIFNLPTAILQKAKIPLNKLRALAYITEKSQNVYFPVILGTPSPQYEFVIYSPERVVFTNLEVRQNGKVIPGSQSPRPNPIQGEVIYTWNPANAPVNGRYELYVQAKGENQTRAYSYYFEHQNNWLK